MAPWWTILIPVTVLILVIVLSRHVLRHGGSGTQIVKGNICIFAGLIVLLSLYLTWARSGNLFLIGFDIDATLFPPLRLITMFLLILSLLMISGGFLSLVAYSVGRKVSVGSSILALFMCSFAVSFFTFARTSQNESFYSPEYGAWICIFGSIVGVIGAAMNKAPSVPHTNDTHPAPVSISRSQRPRSPSGQQPQRMQVRSEMCPACGHNRLRPGQDICDECGRKLTGR